MVDENLKQSIVFSSIIHLFTEFSTLISLKSNRMPQTNSSEYSSTSCVEKIEKQLNSIELQEKEKKKDDLVIKLQRKIEAMKAVMKQQQEDTTEEEKNEDFNRHQRKIKEDIHFNEMMLRSYVRKMERLVAMVLNCKHFSLETQYFILIA